MPSWTKATLLMYESIFFGLKSLSIYFFEVMFKKRAGMSRDAVILNGFKNIPVKASVNRVHNNYAFENVGN